MQRRYLFPTVTIALIAALFFLVSQEEQKVQPEALAPEAKVPASVPQQSIQAKSVTPTPTQQPSQVKAPEPKLRQTASFPLPVTHWRDVEIVEQAEYYSDDGMERTRLHLIHTDSYKNPVRIEETATLENGVYKVKHVAEMAANNVLISNTAYPNAESLRAAAEAQGLQVERIDTRSRFYTVYFEPLALKTYSKALEVIGTAERGSEPNYIVHAAATPDDPSFNDGTMWGLKNDGSDGGLAGFDIDAEGGWDTQTDASSVVVAVLDTGILMNHADLTGNIWTNPNEVNNNGIDDDGNGYVDDINGYDFYNDDDNPTDDNGHGSHVAGTIGARGDNGTGVTGVCWQVQLMPLKFLSKDNAGDSEGVIMGVDYAADIGADVLNASFGGGFTNQLMFEAFEDLAATGCMIVAAAGNDSSNLNQYVYSPGGYALENMVTVAGSNNAGGLYTLTNVGMGKAHIFAPGQNIYSTDNKAGSYKTRSGTSMATPHVAGALALLKAAYPTESSTELIARMLGGAEEWQDFLFQVNEGRSLNLLGAMTFTHGAPTILDRIRHVTDAEAGDTITYRVHASGKGISYQWKKDGVDLPGETSSLLRLESISQADEGLYEVVLTNAHGTFTDSTVLLLDGNWPSDIPTAAEDADGFWTSYGDVDWAVTSQNVGASTATVLRSGSVGGGAQSYLSTIVDGPAEVSFRWKVTSSSVANDLTVYVDGKEHARISGNQDWALQTIQLEEVGYHKIDWVFIGNAASGSTSDAGYIDDFSVVAETARLTILSPIGGNISTDSRVDRAQIGATITVDAQVIEGYEFSSWSGDLSGTQLTKTFVVNHDMVIDAKFVANYDAIFDDDYGFWWYYWGEEKDPEYDHDSGVTNLMAYALRMYSWSSGSRKYDEPEERYTQLPKYELEAGSGSDVYHTLRFYTPAPMPTDITYEVQASSDMVDWSENVAYTNAQGEWVENTATVEQTLYKTSSDCYYGVTVKDIQPAANYPRRYLRLKVTMPE